MLVSYFICFRVPHKFTKTPDKKTAFFRARSRILRDHKLVCKLRLRDGDDAESWIKKYKFYMRGAVQAIKNKTIEEKAITRYGADFFLSCAEYNLFYFSIKFSYAQLYLYIRICFYL